MKKKLYFEYFFLIFLGILTSLSLPPYNYFFLNFVTFSLFFIFLSKKHKVQNDKWNFFLYGWLFGFGYFASNLYWISISLTFDINFKFLIPFVLILIPSCLAIFYGITTFLIAFINLNKTLTAFFLFSLLFGITEFFRGTLLTGFPWNLVAYSFSNNLEIIQVISFVGTYAFNTFCISIFTCPAIFLLLKNKKAIIVGILFLFSPLIFYIVGSSIINNFDKSASIKNEYVLRAIGSNIELERFYGNIKTKSVIDELISLSSPDLSKKTFFIWPEGIIPNTNQSQLKEYRYLFDGKFNENHILGIGINNLVYEEGKEKYYNSLSIFDHEINLINVYNKVNLVPFGEFLPFENILSNIGLKVLTNNYQSYSSGKKRNIIEINQKDFSFKLLPLICYEIIYSGKIFNNSEFDYLVNISEDGWFGNSVGPEQHYAHSIFRAVESGKYIIRSSNNGIAAIVNPKGVAEKKILRGDSGFIDFNEKKITNRTWFSIHGNKMFLLIILLYIFLAFSFKKIS